MDEVDHIIIHSLRQIGCDLDDELKSLSQLSPEILVETVSKCLSRITDSDDLPKTLPPGMAQRYSVTAALAEACVVAGFRGDIGYQTFLYSNVTELRRVFMYLIERLPKEREKSPSLQPTDLRSKIKQNVAQNINFQLHSAWTPQYCKKDGILISDNIVAIQASTNSFTPQSLNVPHLNQSNATKELREYWLKRSPTIFQQTNSQTLAASLIHKNDLDRYGVRPNFPDFLISVQKQNYCGSGVTSEPQLVPKHFKSPELLALNNLKIASPNDIVRMPEISHTDKLNFDIDKLKQTIEQCFGDRAALQVKMTELKLAKQSHVKTIDQLKERKLIAERTEILLENPETNMEKMVSIVQASEARLKKLEAQWLGYRGPMLQQLEETKNTSSNKYSENDSISNQIRVIREKADGILEDIKTNVALQAHLRNKLSQLNQNVSRDAYTSRIFEITNNIRKQKMDIDKVLQDTRELQKEINHITGQLDRQFTVTDNLLFQNAKRDEQTKAAYKYLINVHSDCDEIVKIVQDIGSVTREIRDIEDQVETERQRDIASSLKQITNDLKSAKREYQELREQIKRK